MRFLLSRHLSPISVLAVLACVMAPAWAQVSPQPTATPARPRQHDPHQRDLSDAVRRAERAGQVLSAEHVQYDGRDLNRVKIVDDQGRVRVYWDDPAPGRGRQDDGDARDTPKSRTRTRHDDDGDPTL